MMSERNLPIDVTNQTDNFPNCLRDNLIKFLFFPFSENAGLFALLYNLTLLADLI